MYNQHMKRYALQLINNISSNLLILLPIYLYKYSNKYKNYYLIILLHLFNVKILFRGMKYMHIIVRTEFNIYNNITCCTSCVAYAQKSELVIN